MPNKQKMVAHAVKKAASEDRIRAPNRHLTKGEIGEHLAAAALQAEYPDHILVPSKGDGVRGPDHVMWPCKPGGKIIVDETKTINGGSRSGNLTNHLGKTASGRQGSLEYIKEWSRVLLKTPRAW